MDYEIVFVDDLPAGHDFMLVQIPGKVLIAYRQSEVTPEVLEDSWAAFRALVPEPVLVAV